VAALEVMDIFRLAAALKESVLSYKRATKGRFLVSGIDQITIKAPNPKGRLFLKINL
jgi:hypothetical protein